MSDSNVDSEFANMKVTELREIVNKSYPTHRSAKTVTVETLPRYFALCVTPSCGGVGGGGESGIYYIACFVDVLPRTPGSSNFRRWALIPKPPGQIAPGLSRRCVPAITCHTDRVPTWAAVLAMHSGVFERARGLRC